ncbi:hypothetical protein GCM10009853_066190 [Glycomyces scopariae]
MIDMTHKESPDVFKQCSSGGCVCGVRQLLERENERGPREGEDIDSAEMRVLLTAVRTGYETVRSDPRLAARRHTATDAWNRAVHQLARLRTTIESDRIERAAARLENAEREALESKRRPVWLKLVRWPVVIGIGTFDVWYFSQVFRYLTSQSGDATAGGPSAAATAFENFVAIVPGIVLAVVIAASADMLARPLRAWRAASFRRPARGDAKWFPHAMRATAAWARRTLWWMLPFLFVAFLLFVIGTWAVIRAEHPTPPSEGYEWPAVMLLIVLLSVGAMVVALLADDPVAEELLLLRWRLRMLEWGYRRQASRAEKHIADYDSAWSDLRTLHDDLEGLLRVKMLSAWESFILRLRSLHRMASNVKAADQSDDCPNLARPLFEGIPQPALEPGPLLEIRRLIGDRKPDSLRSDKFALDRLFRAQVRASVASPGDTVAVMDHQS